MSDTAVDDRELARRTLEEGSESAFTQLLEMYTPRLRQRAVRWLARSRALVHHGDADDLVQQFLLEKLLPLPKRRVMLGPVASSGRPLGLACAPVSRISCSRSSAVSLCRCRRNPPERARTSTTRKIALWRMCRTSSSASRRSWPPFARYHRRERGAVPYAAVLLLQERLFLANRIADSFAPENGRTIGNDTVRELVEAIAVWTPAEVTTPMPPRALTLQAVWKQICDNTEDRPQRQGRLKSPPSSAPIPPDGYSRSCAVGCDWPVSSAPPLPVSCSHTGRPRRLPRPPPEGRASCEQTPPAGFGHVCRRSARLRTPVRPRADAARSPRLEFDLARLSRPCSCHRRRPPHGDSVLALLSLAHRERGRIAPRYLAALRQAVADALRLDWWWGQSEGNYVEWHGLGLSGVYVIWDNRVFKTGFLHRSAEYPPAAPLYDRLNNPLPRRRYEKRLSAVPADTEDERYLLFHENLLLVQKVYENACDRNAVHAWGSKVFVTRPPRMGKWTQLLAGSPAPTRSEEPPR